MAEISKRKASLPNILLISKGKDASVLKPSKPQDGVDVLLYPRYVAKACASNVPELDVDTSIDVGQ